MKTAVSLRNTFVSKLTGGEARGGAGTTPVITVSKHAIAIIRKIAVCARDGCGVAGSSNDAELMRPDDTLVASCQLGKIVHYPVARLVAQHPAANAAVAAGKSVDLFGALPTQPSTNTSPEPCS